LATTVQFIEASSALFLSFFLFRIYFIRIYYYSRRHALFIRVMLIIVLEIIFITITYLILLIFRSSWRFTWIFSFSLYLFMRMHPIPLCRLHTWSLNIFHKNRIHIDSFFPNVVKQSCNFFFFNAAFPDFRSLLLHEIF